MLIIEAKFDSNPNCFLSFYAFLFSIYLIPAATQVADLHEFISHEHFMDESLT